MQMDNSLAPTGSSGQTKSSWTRAYLRFLTSKDESLMLKVAPLALAGLLPVDILSNIVPVVGELDDIGFLVVLIVVAIRTGNRVRRYR